MKKIMIIDDDVNIGNMLEETLHLEGYEVTRAYSGTEALLILKTDVPDLILLDLMLPGLSGEEILPKIENIPVIVLSAKTMVDTKVFDVNELLARIVVQLRKADSSASPDETILRSGDVTLNTELLFAEVGADKQEVTFTRTECAILKILMLNAGKPIGRNTILDRISYDTPDCTERSLKQHISNIRKKLESVNGTDYIEAVYGIGFKFKS